MGFVLCFAHRLELALKQALKEWFEPITTCLMNLYYLYEKSSKKLRELKVLHKLLKEICKFEDNQVKPHRATGTRWIAHKLEALHNMLDKYGLYMQHFENIIADTSKQTDKAKLEGKRRQLQITEILVFGALFFDLLEPAKILSLTTQKEDVDLIKVVESIGSTQKRYTRLLDRVTKDPEAVFEFPRLKGLLSQIKSSNFYNNPSSDAATHKYQDTVLLYFTQGKEKLRKATSKILQSI